MYLTKILTLVIGFAHSLVVQFIPPYPEKAHRLWEIKNNKKHKTKLKSMYFYICCSSQQEVITFTSAICLSWQPEFRSGDTQLTEENTWILFGGFLGIVFHVVILSILFSQDCGFPGEWTAALIESHDHAGVYRRPTQIYSDIQCQICIYFLSWPIVITVNHGIYWFNATFNYDCPSWNFAVCC